jgi:hypothetical protein
MNFVGARTRGIKRDWRQGAFKRQLKYTLTQE